MSLRSGVNGRVRVAIACGATALVLGPLIWLWQASLLPSAYSAMDMGYADYGGGPIGHPMAHGGHAHGVMADRSVTSLTADPTRPADVAVTLTARKERFRLPSGKFVNGYTLNGQSPGPIIRATAG